MTTRAMTAETLVFLGAKRTPFGKYGGTLKSVHPRDLTVHCAQAALEQSKVDPQNLDHILCGSVLTSTIDHAYLPRHLGLKLGAPVSTPALMVNRLCGTGFQLVAEAFQQMNLGETKIALLAGVENMSLAPYWLTQARWGQRLGDSQIHDSLTGALFDTHVQLPMAITAENLATQYQISREQADTFALESHLKAAQAYTKGYFKEEVTTYVSAAKEPQTLDRDEHLRAECTIESLTKLKTVFKKDGVVTAGNASGIVDGACALVVATESEAKKKKLEPLGRLVGYSVVGCDPKVMGIGPVPAIRKLLTQLEMKLDQMDVIEVNEAFAPQVLAVQKELQIPKEKLNVNGGAIALGHPLAASGTRILTHLLYELKRRKARYGLGSACIGGGQGIAMVVEVF